MRCPHQQGNFAFPVKYGYGFVGRIVEGSAPQLGETVFCLHPHQTHAVVSSADVYKLPQEIPARRGILSANMETALNVIWDSGMSAGDRVLVVGAGVVGLLVGWLASRFPGADVEICDTDANKRAVARSLGLSAVEPDEISADCDIAINASASGAGLQCALGSVAHEARVIEASWYGDDVVSLRLGHEFHSRRLHISSSQVGYVSPTHRPRWTYARRMEKAMSFLCDPVLDCLITHEIDFNAAPDQLPPLYSDPAALGIVLRYAPSVSGERRAEPD